MEENLELSNLLNEKERLERHLEVGKNILVFSELDFVREKLNDINIKIKSLQKKKGGMKNEKIIN